MNEKFFALPQPKQEAIINAGFRIFSQNTYKKSPMSEIADAAGISKSLLFHYFHNKKELYLFLWNRCTEITMNAIIENKCYEQKDLFNMMYMGLKTKVDIMRRYPHLGAFSVKCYYEKDPDVCGDIQKLIAKHTDFASNPGLANVDPSQFIPGLDLQMMYKDMYWASEGYLWEKSQQNDLNADTMEQEFMKLIDFWKSVYMRKET